VGCQSFRAVFVNPDWTPNAHTPLPQYAIEDELSQYAVIWQYAPLFLHYTFEDTRLNFLTRVDYDGDLDTNNNKDNLYTLRTPDNELPAAVYYAIVATDTHYFLTYFLYHARDAWEKSWCKGLYWWLGGCHENDGESVQLVIERAHSEKADRLVLIAVQSHNTHTFFLLDEEQPPERLPPLYAWRSQDASYHRIARHEVLQDRRPVIYVEPGKHGLALRPDDLFANMASVCRPPSFETAQILRFSPTRQRGVGDRWQADRMQYEYSLESIKTTFWDRYIGGYALGRKGMMEGGVRVTLARGSYITTLKKIPRYFNGNEWSGLFVKTNAGLMPFYFGEGKLFFDPAYYYAEVLEMSSQEWATTYEYNPYYQPPGEDTSKKKPEDGVGGDNEL